MSAFNQFFGLRENPFNQTPDSSLFFPSEKHRTALDALYYAVSERKGFVVITGEIGCGKTTVARTLLKKIHDHIQCALITNTHLSPKGILSFILEDLGVPYKDGPKERLIMQLNQYLLQQMKEDRNVVLIIDEAQNLSAECLEEVRMLSNLETEKEKLLQIVLIGQPELRQKLELPRLEQLRQRIRVSYHLAPLNEEESRNYIRHRLEKVRSNGLPVEGIFRDDALQAVYRHARGVPRVINMICEHALLSAFVSETREITGPMIGEVVQELNVGRRRSYEQIYQSA